MFFTFEIYDSRLNIGLVYEIFISHPELEHFVVRNTLWLYEMASEYFVKVRPEFFKRHPEISGRDSPKLG